MRAEQITRFGGPEVLDVVDLPDAVPGDGEQLYEVSAAGITFADTALAQPSAPSPTSAFPVSEAVRGAGDSLVLYTVSGSRWVPSGNPDHSPPSVSAPCAILPGTVSALIRLTPRSRASPLHPLPFRRWSRSQRMGR